MIEEIKRRTGWKKIDEVKIKGDQRGRECTALANGRGYNFLIRFDTRGGIATFNEI